MKKVPTSPDKKTDSNSNSNKTTINPSPKATFKTQLYLSKDLKQKNSVADL